jgi:hypothetical protein
MNIKKRTSLHKKGHRQRVFTFLKRGLLAVGSGLRKMLFHAKDATIAKRVPLCCVFTGRVVARILKKPTVLPPLVSSGATL